LKKLISILILIFFILLLTDCGDITNPNSNNNSIRGLVTDASGKPVINAIIEISLKTNLITPLSNQSINILKPYQLPTITIRFQIPNESHVKLWITRINSDEILRNLIDQTLPPGYYAVTWDGKNQSEKRVVNGVYTFHLEFTGFHSRRDIFLNGEYSNNDPISDLEYFAKTNNRGVFVIDQSNLPFGYRFLGTDDEGNLIGIFEVTRAVKVWALHKDYAIIFVDNVYVDEESGTDVIMKFN
jgi:hypothetical protein